MANDSARVLQLTLYDETIGYLTGFRNGRNVLSFADAFKTNPERPTLSVVTHPKFPRANKLLAQPWASNQKLHPLLSNLLPEGALRELIAQGLKVHIDNEFELLSYLGRDLPGALVVTPLQSDKIPTNILTASHDPEPVIHGQIAPQNKFSLAGVQMKFSMRASAGHYHLTKGDALGDWIIKTPSNRHNHVPANEYTAMTLAALVGITIPEIKLINMAALGLLPQIDLPNEAFAFAIKRFDRNNNRRIHMEDFAQILAKYPHEKYNSANYEQIARVIYNYSADPITDIQQFAKRLLVNLLLGNGDAHLKNWSLLYADRINPRLSPAYDIVTTCVYVADERQMALNMARSKEWYRASFATFSTWAKHAEIPWRALKPHLQELMERARDLWPSALQNLPMHEPHKNKLKAHWRNLSKDFRI